MRVTRESHPNVFSACMMVLQDTGGVNSREPAPESFTLPYYGNSKDFDGIEAALAGLKYEELEAFCIGEESESRKIARDNIYLVLFSCVLNNWFEERF